jgi:hypothetical protein
MATNVPGVWLSLLLCDQDKLSWQPVRDCLMVCIGGLMGCVLGAPVSRPLGAGSRGVGSQGANAPANVIPMGEGLAALRRLLIEMDERGISQGPPGRPLLLLVGIREVMLAIGLATEVLCESVWS